MNGGVSTRSWALAGTATAVKWVMVVCVLAWSLVPIIWTVMTAVKDTSLIFASPVFLFRPDLAGFRDALSANGIYPQLINSVVVAVCTTIASVACGVLAAYAFSRFEFVGRRTLMLGLLATRLLPPFSAVVPLYLLASDLDLIDSRTILVVIYTALNIPFATWLLKSYIDAVPREIEESAAIDGCGSLRTIVRITMPLIAPGLVATGIFVFFLAWNEFMFAYMFTTVSARTMPVVLAEARGGEQVLWQTLTAQATILIIPAVIAGMFLQKYLVRGLTAGAVK